MKINPDLDKPIFIQIAEQLEDSIFTGVFPEETKIPSTNEISVLLSINPHTVLKGMNLLVDILHAMLDPRVKKSLTQKGG